MLRLVQSNALWSFCEHFQFNVGCGNLGSPAAGRTMFMSDKGLTTAWLALGIGMAYLALNLVAATQQWPLGFALPALVSFDDEDHPRGAILATKAFYGVALLVPALLVQLLLTAVFALRKSRSSRAERVPVSSALGVLPETRLGKVVQAAAFILFVAWPTYAVGHFVRKLFGAPAACEEIPNIVVQHWAHLWPGPPPGCPGRFRIEGLLLYEPFITPWALGVGALITAAAFILVLWLILRPRRHSARLPQA